jgi:glutamate synthase (NADPH/NADH) large chain
MFKGNPDHVVNYFEFLVNGLREIMAELGFRTIKEMVGQSQCLKFKKDVDHWKYKGLNLKPILFKETIGQEEGLHNSKTQDHLMEEILDWKFVEAAQNAIKKGEKVTAEFDIQTLTEA